MYVFTPLTHWSRVMHICISELTIIVSDNGWLPGWCQAIIWTNAGIFFIEELVQNSDGCCFDSACHQGPNITLRCHLTSKRNPIVKIRQIIHNGISFIITLVRHKKARFESKMHGSTQKSPVRHKNARFDTKMPSPACTSWRCHYQTSPLRWEIFFFQF